MRLTIAFAVLIVVLMVYGVVLPYREGFNEPHFPEPIGVMMDIVLEPFLLVELMARFRTAFVRTRGGARAATTFSSACVLRMACVSPFVRGGQNKQVRIS